MKTMLLVTAAVLVVAAMSGRALRAELAGFEVGDTSMPTVVYGMIGGGHVTFGVVDGKVNTFEADPAAKTFLEDIGREGTRGSDALRVGVESIWQGMRHWELTNIRE